jgi:hypothetical protein
VTGPAESTVWDMSPATYEFSVNEEPPQRLDE